MYNVSIVGCFQLRSIRIAGAHHGFLWGYTSWKDLSVAGCVYLPGHKGLLFKVGPTSSPPLPRVSSTYILTIMWPNFKMFTFRLGCGRISLWF